jgi:hypothetical protein
VAQRRWHNYRTQLTPALKVLPVVATTIFCLVVGADRYGSQYEDARYDAGKTNTEMKLEHRMGLDHGRPEVDSSALSFKDR